MVMMNRLQMPMIATGKFDQFNRRPFGAIIAAVGQLVDLVLTQDSSQVAMLRARILSTETGLGENTSVAIALIPSIALITGPRPPAPVLGQTESQNRLDRTFGMLLRLFATPSSPLLLFIDDLQWADASSLRLLRALVTDSECRFSMVVGAYRDDELLPATPLAHFLEATAKAGVLHTLTIRPLGCVLIANLLADSIGFASIFFVLLFFSADPF